MLETYRERVDRRRDSARRKALTLGTYKGLKPRPSYLMGLAAGRFPANWDVATEPGAGCLARRNA